jgi:hypothetical protein
MPSTHLLERPAPGRAPAPETPRPSGLPAHLATAAALLAGGWSGALALGRPVHAAGLLALGLLAAALRPSRRHGEHSAYLAVLGGAGTLLLVLCAVSLDPVWILPAAALGLALPRR